MMLSLKPSNNRPRAAVIHSARAVLVLPLEEEGGWETARLAAAQGYRAQGYKSMMLPLKPSNNPLQTIGRGPSYMFHSIFLAARRMEGGGGARPRGVCACCACLRTAA